MHVFNMGSSSFRAIALNSSDSLHRNILSLCIHNGETLNISMNVRNGVQFFSELLPFVFLPFASYYIFYFCNNFTSP